MSSTVKRRDRVRRPPRTCLADFSDVERQTIEAAREWFPGDVAVFGSRARGNWADDSDIDLGVNGYVRSHHTAVKEWLSGLHGLKVELFKIEHALTHRSVLVV